jgi:protein-tyrosine phosphatase
LRPGAEGKVFEILIVCTGNVCRSPMAEGILRALLDRHEMSGRARVRSAGTWASSGAAASPNAIVVAETKGISLTEHRSRPLSRSLIRESDLILVMEPVHLEEVLAQEPEAEGRTFLLNRFADPEEGDPAGVEDPFGGSEAAYESAFGELDHLLRVALPRILVRIQDREEQGRSAPANPA